MWIRHQKYFKRTSYVHVFDFVGFNLISYFYQIKGGGEGVGLPKVRREMA